MVLGRRVLGSGPSWPKLTVLLWASYFSSLGSRSLVCESVGVILTQLVWEGPGRCV